MVEAIDQIASDVPLTITSATIPQATLAAPYIYLLQATGGNAPYKWSIQGSLPPGLTISSEGLISGVPSANVTGSYQFVLTVTDSLGKTVKQNLTMTVGGTPTYTPLSITGCSASDVNTPCPLPGATSGQQYLYAFSATGGDPTKAVTWTATPANWLAISTTGSSGVFTGTATPSTSTTVVIDPVTGETRTTVTPGQACTTYTYVVTASQGTPQTTISRTFTVALTGTAAQCAR